MGRSHAASRRSGYGRRSRQSCLGLPLVGCFIVIVAAVLGALVALSGDEPAPKITSEQRVVAERGLSELKREAEQIRRDAIQRRRRQFAIDVTEAELNLLLNDDAAVRERLERRGVNAVFVRVTGGAIRASMTRTVAGMPVQVRAVLEPEIDAPRSVIVRIASLSVGYVPAPVAPAQRLADEVGRLLSEKVTDTNVVLSDLTIHEGRIGLKGRIE